MTEPDNRRGPLHHVVLTLRMIKFTHSIFALPFALLAACIASRGLPEWRKLFWIVVACVFARSAAMAFNRLHDHVFDELNPRTQGWALPSGALTRGFVTGFCIACSAGFVYCALMLNWLSFALSPVALAILLGYSTAKRWTRWSHFFLGLALGIAPVGAWIAVTGTIGWPALALAGGVMLWSAGFDIIYSCQDAAFDRKAGLHSLPSRWGNGRALAMSALCHAGALALFAVIGTAPGLGFCYAGGLTLAAALLVKEQLMVSPHDLSKVNVAFFTLNGWVSVLLFLGGLADLLLAGG